MVRKVLVLTDFTDVGFDCVSYGMEFCRHYGLAADILHVETVNHGVVDNDARSKTSKLADLYNSKFNLGASVVIKPGLLSQVISNEVRSNDYLLIILGTHGISGGFQTLKGSAATKVITSQNIPILVVQSRKFSPINNVLLPIKKSTSMNSSFWDLVKVVKELGGGLEIVCRNDGYEKSCFYKQQFSDSEKDSELSILDSDGDSFGRQVISHAYTNNFGLIVSLPSESENLELDIMLEQLLFNVPQIPVMCSGY